MYRKSSSLLGWKLKQARESFNLTQEEAGAKVGVSGATWSRWESGKHVPTEGNLEAIAREFDLDPNDLSPRVRAIVEGAQSRVDNSPSTMTIGGHYLQLNPDGSLDVNGCVRIYPPRRN